MEGDFNLIGVNDNTPKNDSPPDLEGDSNPIGVNDITPKSNSPLDPFVALRGLAFLHIEDTSDHSLDDDTSFDTEEDEPNFFTGDTLFILEDVDPDTENSKFVLCPMTPYSAETSLNIEDSSQNINGDLVPNCSLSRRFRCHTSNVDHHYCMLHGSKYCCRAPEPNWDVKETIEKELYEDCLNYLECSDVMTDYANGIWLSALLGNESVFLLETDQDDEPKASQNESDVLPSGVTYVNEGSSNTLAMDDLASLCVSHSKAPAVDEKGDLSGDLLKALETEMVITVGHQQNNTSSPQKKKKCKLPCASTAIQDDQAGIEVENSPEEHRSASMKRSNSNPFMELYLVTMTDEPGSDPLICDRFEEREQGVEKLILEEDTIDKQCPEILTEEEVHQLSEGEIQDQFTLESTNFYDSGQSQMQEEQLMEADIAVEHVDINSVCTIESAEEDDTKEDNYIKEDDHIKEDNHTKEDDHTKEDVHTKLIKLLKANIRSTELPSELKVLENPEQGEGVQELEGTQIHPVESKNRDGSHSFEKVREYIQENYGIENEESPVSGLLVSFKNTEINEDIGNESVIVDCGLESVNSELHTADSKPKMLESVSQIVDITLQVINSDLHLCTISFDEAIDTKFSENMTDNLEVCKQGYEHEISSINGNEYSQTMDNCAIKTDDLLGQPPRENADSDSQSMENCALNPDDLADQPPRENSESDNQTMANCALNPDDLVDQPPRANDESDNMTMANCTIKTNDLVGIPPRENAESDNQTLDNYAIKIDDLVGQPPRENDESDNQTTDNCAIKIDDLVGLPPRENAESDNQTLDNYAIKTDDLVGQPPRENDESDNQTTDNCAIKIDDLVGLPSRENAESGNQSIDNCAIKIDDLVGQPPRENDESDNQTMDNCAIKIDDLVGQPPRENYESDNQTMDNCAIKNNDLVGLPSRENAESDNQTMDNCAIKNDDLVVQPPRENDESDNQTSVYCAKKMYDLADKPPEENNTMSIPKVSNDTNVCLEPTEGSSSLMVDNSPSTDDNLRTNSVQNVSGKQMKRNASAHQGIGMHSKKKALEKFPLHSFCASISREHHDIINNVVENYQGGIAERHLSCFGGNGEMLSLVKTKDGMCSNSTEIEKAHSLHVKNNIPNSQELSQVCRDPDTIRGAELVRAQSIDLDQSGGTSCSLYFISSPSQCEKGTDSKMVKKKFKSAGKEATKNTENEAKALDVNEGFQPEEEKRLKRQSSIDTAVSKDSKNAPKILHGIQAEMFPDRSGNLKLFCHFGDIHADSTITWTKDSKLLARMHRSPKDDSPVSLAIVQTSKKDQGVYLCTLKNMHGKVTTEFQLTSEVLEQLTRYQDVEGGEEVEFNQLFFREDFISDMYFGGNLHGRIATEDLHFGEGVHRKAFRSTVMCGLLPVFNPGHLCVLKVHNAIAYGTKTNDELVQKNYKLAVQECHVQNTAREYAKIYAAEAEELKEFGTVPEIIPIFLIHRPANNIPYATVEEELIGDFVKYSVKDGKEINVLRRDSEAGQKCCTFQHWVYERTNGNLLVTDMQGVGMKLTDVGIATISKGYKGFKGNCAVSFIDQFKALHQCNKYCEILRLQPLRPVNPKQKKPAPTKEKAQPIPTTSRKSRNSTKPKNKT